MARSEKEVAQKGANDWLRGYIPILHQGKRV